MNDKKTWYSVLGGGSAVLLLTGFLVWNDHSNIETMREDVAGMRENIAQSRKLLTGTGELERDVIVLRETEDAIKEILPDDKDVNNFVKDLHRFEEESGVRITGLKKKATDASRGKKTEKQDFDKVCYTLTLEADAFQWLALLDRVESHSRFMSVPNFKLQAAPRRQVEDQGTPSHKIMMDVETYVYAPQGALKPGKIDGYARKRELLLGEIARRRSALAIPAYEYRGARGRRDPWVDPRVPIASESDGGLSVEEQIQIVEELVGRAKEATDLYDEVKKADTLVKQVTLTAELEQRLAKIEEDLRRVQDQELIRFVPSERRLQLEVADPVLALRSSLVSSSSNSGPSLERLRELDQQMSNHMQLGEYSLTLTAYNTVSGSLPLAERDPERGQLVERIRAIASDAKIAIDFQTLKLDIGGVVIVEGSDPVALINGKSLSEGEMVSDELVIRAIRRDEIEFIFRGVILFRRL